MKDRGELDLLYQEMRKIAAIHLSRSVQHPSIQPTQLVHEAWLRLSSKDWKSRTHFLALASRTMRMLLIDALRARMAEKHGAGLEHIPVAAGTQFAGPDGALPLERIIDLDQALNELARNDTRKAKVVEMRFFGGMELQEIAEVLEVSPATVKRDWEFARAWLYARLSGSL